MNDTLVNDFRKKHAIRTMVASGFVHNDISTKWGKKLSDEEHVAKTIADATGGCILAMTTLANMYANGTYGVKIDKHKAYQWYDRAARSPASEIVHCDIAANAASQAGFFGEYVVWLGIAYGRGSLYGCMKLAMLYARGLHGMRQNEEIADEYVARCVENKLQYGLKLNDQSQQMMVEYCKKRNITCPDFDFSWKYEAKANSKGSKLLIDDSIRLNAPYDTIKGSKLYKQPASKGSNLYEQRRAKERSKRQRLAGSSSNDA